MTTLGETSIGTMRADGPTWKQFCELLWNYTYVRNKGPLTDKILHAWYLASAGNTAFAKLTFALAQRNEIGGRELIDEISFDTVANTDLLFLRPAIRSLLSNKATALAEFDDLFVTKKYKELRGLLGIEEEKPKPIRVAQDFPELEAKKEGEGRKKRSQASNREHAEVDLPEEDPLLLGD